MSIGSNPMKKMTVEDLSKNGVRVTRKRFFDEKGQLLGSVVEADCGCHGLNKTHTTIHCPRLEGAREFVHHSWNVLDRQPSSERQTRRGR